MPVWICEREREEGRNTSSKLTNHVSVWVAKNLRIASVSTCFVGWGCMLLVFVHFDFMFSEPKEINEWMCDKICDERICSLLDCVCRFLTFTTAAPPPPPPPHTHKQPCTDRYACMHTCAHTHVNLPPPPPPFPSLSLSLHSPAIFTYTHTNTHVNPPPSLPPHSPTVLTYTHTHTHTHTHQDGKHVTAKSAQFADTVPCSESFFLHIAPLAMECGKSEQLSKHQRHSLMQCELLNGKLFGRGTCGFDESSFGEHVERMNFSLPLPLPPPLSRRPPTPTPAPSPTALSFFVLFFLCPVWEKLFSWEFGISCLRKS